jgi:hypothetical protein
MPQSSRVRTYIRCRAPSLRSSIVRPRITILLLTPMPPVRPQVHSEDAVVLSDSVLQWFKAVPPKCALVSKSGQNGKEQKDFKFKGL